MENLNEYELKQALIDVRKSYRLIYAYQRRILDLAKFIGNIISFEYNGGWPKFSNECPKGGKGSLDNWSWDWLNMYHYSFIFKPKFTANSGILFSIILVSDTGFFESDTEDKRDIGDFKSADESNSHLIISFGKDYWDTPIGDMLKKYKSHLTQIDRPFISKNPNKDGIFISKIYELSSFLNEDSTRKNLRNFIDICYQNGIEVSEIKINSFY